MNQVTLIGNVVKDPEIRSTSTGKKVASLSIAVNNRMKDQNGQELTDYFNLEIWDKTAEITELYVKKGYKIAIIGRLKNEVWDKPDGTKGYGTKIVVSSLDILTSRAEAERIQQNSTNNNAVSNNSNSNNASNNSVNTSSSENKNEKLPEINIDDLDLQAQVPF
jgi:single-strand DNA-binding protein